MENLRESWPPRVIGNRVIGKNRWELADITHESVARRDNGSPQPLPSIFPRIPDLLWRSQILLRSGVQRQNGLRERTRKRRHLSGEPSREMG